MDNKEIEKTLLADLGAYNHNAAVFENILGKLESKFLGTSKHSAKDVELINIFIDMIQAKTFKYITKEKLEKYNAFDIDAYISSECQETRLANLRITFSVLSQKISRFKNNPASLELYNRAQNTGDDYY